MRRDFPEHKDMILIGHSMGGVISRLMVLDAGEQIWREIFGKSSSETPLRGRSRQLLEESLIFNHQPGIGRVVFLSAPHRGSELATSWIGRIGSRLVRTPAFIADVLGAAQGLVTFDRAGLRLNLTPNSIDTLSPDNRFVRAADKLQIRPGIPYHTIAGDRGKGDGEKSSDGVVAYWSSHLAGAQSEKIIPSNHSTHQHAEGIAEVARILKLHTDGKSGR